MNKEKYFMTEGAKRVMLWVLAVLFLVNLFAGYTFKNVLAIEEPGSFAIFVGIAIGIIFAFFTLFLCYNADVDFAEFIIGNILFLVCFIILSGISLNGNKELENSFIEEAFNYAKGNNKYSYIMTACIEDEEESHDIKKIETCFYDTINRFRQARRR